MIHKYNITIMYTKLIIIISFSILYGPATALSNWLSVILMIVPVFLGYLNRINVEEKFMTEQMGTKYIDYQNKTKKLIPGIF